MKTSTNTTPGKPGARTVQAPCWPGGTPRSMGGPFDILYQPRATPKPSTAPGKRGPKPSQTYHHKTLAALRDPTHSQFCTAIPKAQDRDKTTRIAKAAI